MLSDKLLSQRILLIAGKGGVGRSTVSAAIAKYAARQGRRTLLADLGEPGSNTSPLANLFEQRQFMPVERELASNLHGCQLQASYGQELFLKQVLPGGALFAAALKSKALQGFLNTAPSFLEMGWFYHILYLLKKQTAYGEMFYQTVVIDLPATGHALALTSLPDILLQLVKVGPIAKALKEGQAIFKDAQQTAVWVLTLPEILPVTEALELVGGLEKTNMNVAGIILNRFPEDPFTDEEKQEIAHFFKANNYQGSIEFEKIIRAKQAKQRLTQKSPLPVFSIPEIKQQPLVDEMHELLHKGGAHE